MDSNQIFKFRVGAYNCISIQDEHSHQNASAFFSIVPDDEQHLVPFDKEDNFDGSFNCLLIETGTQRILIDSGNGVETDGDGRLFQHLASLNIPLDSINIVVLTHAHADHYAGMLTAAGQKTFPNATYMMWRDEWEHYSSDKNLEFEKGRDSSGARIDFLQKWFLPLEPHLTLLDQDSTEIAPGIQAIYAPGHTHHHIAVTVESQGEALLIISDAFIHPLQLEHRHWHFPFEVDAEQLKTTRSKLIDYATTSNALVHTYHFAFPGLGRIKKDGAKVNWETLS